LRIWTHCGRVRASGRAWLAATREPRSTEGARRRDNYQSVRYQQHLAGGLGISVEVEVEIEIQYGDEGGSAFVTGRVAPALALALPLPCWLRSGRRPALLRHRQMAARIAQHRQRSMAVWQTIAGSHVASPRVEAIKLMFRGIWVQALQGARTSPLRLILHFSPVENKPNRPTQRSVSNHSLPSKAQGHVNRGYVHFRQRCCSGYPRNELHKIKHQASVHPGMFGAAQSTGARRSGTRVAHGRVCACQAGASVSDEPPPQVTLEGDLLSGVSAHSDS
jgi:hypothetical protein